MSIVIDKAAGLFTLQTAGSTYQMKVDEHGTLLHTYYGKKTSAFDKSYLIFRLNRGFSGNPYEVGQGEKIERSYSNDTLPQEYSAFGTGDYRITALQVKNTDGTRAAYLTYKEYAVESGMFSIPGLPAVYGSAEEADTLIITLEDPVTGIEVKLYYGVLEKYDVITRAVQIINNGSGAVTLEKAASMTLDMPGKDMDLITFHGKWAQERFFQRQTLNHGISSIGSVRGQSSHHYNPFAILCGKDTNEDSGDCYGIHFVYSGEFLMETEKDQTDSLRFQAGLQPIGFAWKLEPGECFYTPETMLSYSSKGFSALSNQLHHTIRENLCRGDWKLSQRPVLINNWEGTYFDFDGDKLFAIAKTASELGVEMFVMDDGWFGARKDDLRGLGDWYPNEEKLGCTLKELGERITGLGMHFGIWFEPEMINMDSDLYRAHPDWAVQIPEEHPLFPEPNCFWMCPERMCRII